VGFYEAALIFVAVIALKVVSNNYPPIRTRADRTGFAKIPEAKHKEGGKRCLAAEVEIKFRDNTKPQKFAF
jgi:hypothetical protein